MAVAGLLATCSAAPPRCPVARRDIAQSGERDGTASPRLSGAPIWPSVFTLGIGKRMSRAGRKGIHLGENSRSALCASSRDQADDVDTAGRREQQPGRGGRGRGRGGRKGGRGGRGDMSRSRSSDRGKGGKKGQKGGRGRNGSSSTADDAMPSQGSPTASVSAGKTKGQPASKQQDADKEVEGTEPKPEHGSNKAGNGADKDLQQAEQTAEEESLELLEWGHVCEQVACFTSTSMAAEIAAAGRLPLGSTLEDSDELLQQTAEAAMELPQLDVSAVLDVRPGLSLLAAGGSLTGLQLDAVSQSITAALRVSALLGLCEGDQQLQAAAADLADVPLELQGSLAHCTALAEVMEGAVNGNLVLLLGELQRCVKKGGDLKDGASEFLELAREEKRANLKELDAIIKSITQFAFQKGISTSTEGSFHMGRQCISVKRGRQGDLPSGGTTLASSNTGATLYVEPTEAIEFNNEATKLAALVKEEETVVIVALSRGVGSCSDSLLRLLSRVVNLDLACARAKHAAWMGASRPVLVPSSGVCTSGPKISLKQIRHPLLLAKSLSAPPLPPLIGDAVVAFNSRFLGRSDAPPVPLNTKQMQNKQGLENIGLEAGEAPKGIDLLVPPETAVVAVTGPNTGGKTASLKTLGLASIMVKAGLFLPVAGDAAEDSSVNPLRMAWFDKVLADVGDGQSLQQSLSTFSGHVRRVQRALDAVTPQSLVLLDELGSGTDPAEGASLACVLLEMLAEKAALTYVTSHFYEVKELAEEKSPTFINVAVEFDLSTLSPTYKLLWGESGSSNALNVATRLGFDPAVLKAAREVLVELGEGGHGGDQRAAELAQSLEEQKLIAKHERDAAAQRKAAHKEKAQSLERELQAMKDRLAAARSAKENLDDELKGLSLRVREITSQHLEGKITREQANKQVAEIQALIPDTSQAMSLLMGLSSVAGEEDVSGWEDLLEGSSNSNKPKVDEDWLPASGERVIVNKMGGGDGVVLRAARRKGGTITVQVGQMSVEMKTTDVSPAKKVPGRMTKEQKMNAMIGRSSPTKKRKGALKQQSDEDDVVLFQTSHNTVDVRGKRADAAIEDVEVALTRESYSRVLFVVHGVGTGALRKQIHERFRRHSMVRKIEMEEKSAGGCSIFYLK